MGATLTPTLSERAFKQCPMCQFAWEGLADFLLDADLSFLGRQKGLDDADPGLIIFTHSCGTTLALEVEKSIISFDAEGRLSHIDLEDAGPRILEGSDNHHGEAHSPLTCGLPARFYPGRLARRA